MRMTGKPLDEKDIEIISLLKDNARISASDISRKTDLSVSTVTDRIKKLERDGIIKQYTVVLDNDKVGLDVTAFVEVSTSDNNYVGVRASIRNFAAQRREIVECHSVTGSSMFILKINAASMNDLERLIAELQTTGGEIQTKTSIVLNTVKFETFASFDD